MPSRTFSRRREPPDRVDDGEAGAHRPLGVVLMRLWVAEIDQHPIAHILGDEPGERGDRVGDAAVIGADHLAQILRIEACRQRGRADQIAEHHGQLPPLGLAGDRGGSGRCCDLRRFAAQSGERGQQLPAVADRSDAEAKQIIRRQFGQHFCVDVVGGEGRCVLLETEPAQPVSDIDRHCRPPSRLSCGRSPGLGLL